MLKELRKLALLSTALAVFSFSSDSFAAVTDNAAFKGNASVSVTSTMNITEVTPIKFGNIAVTCGGTCTAATANLILSPGGTRTSSGAAIVLMNGADQTVPGIPGGSNLETGSQAPGFYTIATGAAAVGNVYISFADATGQLIDAQHPGNSVTLSHATGAETFTVDTFTVAQNDNTAPNSGYATIAANPSDVFGVPITTAADGTATIRVGATLHTTVTAGEYDEGQYKGQFYIMASY